MPRLPRQLAVAIAALSAIVGNSCRKRSTSGGVSHVQKLEGRVLLSGSFPMGTDNSLAYDAQGAQHIAYYDAAAKDLKYVVQSPTGVWSNPVIVDGSSSDVGKQVALAIGPSGKVGVVYLDAAGGHLKFAQLVNGQWQSTVLDPKGGLGEYPSLVYNAKDCPIITYYRPATHDLRCATELNVRNSRSRWVFNTMARGVDPFSSLTINPATRAPALAFQLANGRIQFRNGYRTGGFAPPVVVDRSTTPVSSLSLTFGPGSLPVISYYNASTGALHVAGINTRTRLFNSATVASIAPNADPHATALYNSSNHQIELVYYNAAANGIYIANAPSPSGPFAVNQLQPGGSAKTEAVIQPSSGSVVYTTVNNASGSSTLTVNTAGVTPGGGGGSPSQPGSPAAPTNVAAVAISSGAIQISWTDNPANITGFLIQRSTDGVKFNYLTIAAANSASFSDTGLTANTTYYYEVSALGPNNTIAAGTPNPVSAATLSVNADNPQYLLTPQMLATMRAAAANNTPQWQAFKAQLDAGLNQVTEGNYEGWQLPPIADYALGYQVLKNSDPATASGYADKAIAIMLQGIQDDVRGEWTASRMLLARGDGSTTQFTLPNTGITGATLKVWLPTVTVKAVTKGAPNGQDIADYSAIFLKASNTSDGSADYTQGVDWRYNPDYSDGTIDWSLGSSHQPATGATYYVTEVSANDQSIIHSGYTLNGNTLTFTTAPGANQAVFVEYQYTDATSGLTHQQTGDSRGGFNNILIDAGYTTRNLKYIAIGLDWLWSYQGLSPQLRSQATSMLVQWNNYLANPSVYMANTPASNYGAGHYALRMATAIALQNRDPIDAPQLMAEMQAYHDTYVLPIFAAPASGKGTNQGGFWSEGWNYGPFAIQNVLTSDLAYETAGWGSAAPDKAWANDVITSLLEEQPTQSTIYDGGDGYAYPLPFPSKTILADVAYVSSDPTLKSYANWAIQNYSGSITPGWEDLLYRDPNATATNWANNLPLQYLSPGTGLAVARKDWNYNSTWLSFHSGNLTDAAHQDTGQGALEINRGADPLLVNVAAVTGDQTFQDKSTYGNTMVIDDGGAGQQNYRYAEGVWYGTPGVTMPHFDGTADYTYMQGNYAAAYEKNTGLSNPASELVRDVFYVRGADYVITYDRATTTQASFLKQLRWHFLNAPTVNGDSWSETNGSSKLFGQTYSDVPLTTADVPVTVNGKTVQEIQTNNTTATASVRYVTVIQTASSAVAAMDTSTHVESGDGKVEGTQIGSYVVLFGKNGAVSGGTSYQITAAAGQTTTHYLTDMTPGTTYTLTGANQGTAVADAQGVVTFTTTGTGAAQIVTLT